MGERNDLIERLLNPLWAHMRGGEPYLDDDATLADLKEAAATIASLSEALAEAEKKGAEDWQPIETAPRDGTAILGASSHGVTVSQWFNGRWSGWMLFTDGPTHWRPLPAPPRDLSQGGQHG